jgi:hypothetical protein
MKVLSCPVAGICSKEAYCRKAAPVMGVRLCPGAGCRNQATIEGFLARLKLESCDRMNVEVQGL